MNFKDILGHEKEVGKLKNIIVKNKIAHGYIIDGPKGSGRKTISKAFAKNILCKNSKDDSCGLCSSCIKIEHDNHPDLIYIQPDGKSIKNKQIELLQGDIIRRPYESIKKVYIIDDGDLMTESAQNRLLKTLEEPPEYAIIIMLSSNVNRFLPTILSRSQVIKLNSIDLNKIARFIEEKYNIDKEQSRVYAKLSNGIVGKAIELKESMEFNTVREDTLDMLDKILSKDPIKLFFAIDFFNKYKDEIQVVLDIMLYWFRDLLILKETEEENFIINIDKLDGLRDKQFHIDSKAVVDIIERIERVKKDLKIHVNYQLTIENMLTCIQEVQ